MSKKMLIINSTLFGFMIVFLSLGLFFKHEDMYHFGQAYNPWYGIMYIVGIALGFAIFTYLFFYAIVRMVRHVQETKLTTIAPITLAFVMITSIMYFPILNRIHHEDFSFTHDKWAVASKDEKVLLLDDFFINNDLNTFDKNKILEYFGTPDKIENIVLETMPPQYGGEIFTYELGYRSNNSDDPLDFVININQNQVVSSYSYQ